MVFQSFAVFSGTEDPFICDLSVDQSCRYITYSKIFAQAMCSGRKITTKWEIKSTQTTKCEFIHMQKQC